MVPVQLCISHRSVAFSFHSPARCHNRFLNTGYVKSLIVSKIMKSYTLHIGGNLISPSTMSSPHHNLSLNTAPGSVLSSHSTHPARQPHPPFPMHILVHTLLCFFTWFSPCLCFPCSSLFPIRLLLNFQALAQINWFPPSLLLPAFSRFQDPNYKSFLHSLLPLI